MTTFKSIDDESLQLLLNNLKQKIPDSIHAYCYLRNALDLKKSEYLHSEVYAPDGDICDETFLLVTNMCHFNVFTLYSSSDEGSVKLREALGKCNFINWKEFFLFTCIPTRISNILEPLWETLNIKVSQNPGVTYWLPSDKIKALPTRTLEDAEIRELAKSDAKLINSLWPHRMEGTEKMIEFFIQGKFDLGVFKKDTGKLVSWGLHWFYGGIGTVQTLEEEQGNGYGSAVCTAISKKLDQDGWPVHLIVVKGNEQGKSLFEKKLQFLRIHDNVWIEPLLSK